MGIGFVILIHLIAIFILSIIIALFASLVTFFVTTKERRKWKILLAFISPFVGLYTLYFCGLIGSILVSEIKNVDVGIGDAWYVPLENNCQLLFIDLPEQAYIEKDGQTIISDVMQIEQNGNQILGKTNENKYFSYNTATNELKNFANEYEMIVINSNKKHKLINAIDFYTDKRNDIAGIWFIIVGCISLFISMATIYLLRKIMLGQFILKR